jgi:DNA-binding transcriptional regulator YhcF (GntR family)
MAFTGCSEFALIASGSSLAISQNTYARAYNSMDILTIMGTEKSIKTHVYEKGKKHIYDQAVGYIKK